MLITVKNLTNSCVSTDLGLLSPYATISNNLMPDLAYKALENMHSLVTSGIVLVTTTGESDIVIESPVINYISSNDLPYSPESENGKIYVTADTDILPGKVFTATKNIAGELVWATLGSVELSVQMTASTATYMDLAVSNIPIDTSAIIQTFGSADGTGAITVIDGTSQNADNTAGKTHWACIVSPSDPETPLKIRVVAATGETVSMVVNVAGIPTCIYTVTSPD